MFLDVMVKVTTKLTHYPNDSKSRLKRNEEIDSCAFFHNLPVDGNVRELAIERKIDVKRIFSIV